MPICETCIKEDVCNKQKYILDIFYFAKKIAREAIENESTQKNPLLPPKPKLDSSWFDLQMTCIHYYRKSNISKPIDNDII